MGVGRRTSGVRCQTPPVTSRRARSGLRAALRRRCAVRQSRMLRCSARRGCGRRPRGRRDCSGARPRARRIDRRRGRAAHERPGRRRRGRVPARRTADQRQRLRGRRAHRVRAARAVVRCVPGRALSRRPTPDARRPSPNRLSSCNSTGGPLASADVAVVLVHIDLDGDRLTPSSLVALAAGRHVATSWGATLYAAVIAHDPNRARLAEARADRRSCAGLDSLQTKLARVGADKILVALSDVRMRRCGRASAPRGKASSTICGRGSCCSAPTLRLRPSSRRGPARGLARACCFARARSASMTSSSAIAMAATSARRTAARRSCWSARRPTAPPPMTTSTSSRSRSRRRETRIERRRQLAARAGRAATRVDRGRRRRRRRIAIRPSRRAARARSSDQLDARGSRARVSAHADSRRSCASSSAPPRSTSRVPPALVRIGGSGKHIDGALPRASPSSASSREAGAPSSSSERTRRR